MDLIVVYIAGSAVGLILTIASFILGVRTLQAMEQEQWRAELRQCVAAIKAQ